MLTDSRLREGLASCSYHAISLAMNNFIIYVSGPSDFPYSYFLDFITPDIFVSPPDLKLPLTWRIKYCPQVWCTDFLSWMFILLALAIPSLLSLDLSHTVLCSRKPSRSLASSLTYALPLLMLPTSSALAPRRSTHLGGSLWPQ